MSKKDKNIQIIEREKMVDGKLISREEAYGCILREYHLHHG